MTRAFKAAALLLVSAGVCAADGEKGPKNLGFFGTFASEKNRNKFEGRLDCVYGDPVKGKMCPPVMQDPMAHLKTENVSESGVVGTVERLTGGIYRMIYGSDSEGTQDKEKKEVKEDESALAIFSRCLDDPDDPDCRELQIGNVSPAVFDVSCERPKSSSESFL